MKKRVLAGVLSITLVVTSNSVVFAGESIDGEQIVAEHQATVVEEIVGTEDVCTNIEETRKDFVVEGESLEIEIPKDGDENIVMESEDGEEFSMGLPEEAEDAEAVVTDDGTIVYDTNEDVSVAVQALSEEQDGMTFEGVRTMVTIEDASAPKEYAFAFDLPEGYRIVKDTDFSDELDEYDCGAVYVLNNQGESVNTIDPAWAMDANGNDVETYYKIEENVLIQVVEFDEDSAFPIVADPTSHPNKTKTGYLTKSQVRTIRDKYSQSTCAVITKYIISVGVGIKFNAAIGTGWTTINFAGDLYTNNRYKTWSTIYDEFEYPYAYAKITATYKYHSGKRSYYPTRTLKYTHTKARPI